MSHDHILHSHQQKCFHISSFISFTFVLIDLIQYLDKIKLIVYLLILAMSSDDDEDSTLMTYIKRRRAINRRAAAKSRARLKQHATHVQQVRARLAESQ